MCSSALLVLLLVFEWEIKKGQLMVEKMVEVSGSRLVQRVAVLVEALDKQLG